MRNDDTSLRHANRFLLYVLLTVLSCCWVLFVRPASAQVDQGAITGVVQDLTGAVVPGAQVTLTNTDTGFVLQGKSNGRGDYVFSPIKIGNYTVSASATGYSTGLPQTFNGLSGNQVANFTAAPLVPLSINGGGSSAAVPPSTNVSMAFSFYDATYGANNI